MKKFKYFFIMLMIGIVGCCNSFNEDKYCEEINIHLNFNSYGKQNFLVQHIDIPFDDTLVYIFKSIDDVSQMIDASVYYEKLTEKQIVEFEKVLENNYIIFVPIVLSSSAEFKCQMICKENFTNLTFIIGPFGVTEEFFIEKYTAKIPKECVDGKTIDYKFEIVH